MKFWSIPFFISFLIYLFISFSISFLLSDSDTQANPSKQSSQNYAVHCKCRHYKFFIDRGVPTHHTSCETQCTDTLTHSDTPKWTHTRAHTGTRTHSHNRRPTRTILLNSTQIKHICMLLIRAHRAQFGKKNPYATTLLIFERVNTTEWWPKIYWGIFFSRLEANNRIGTLRRLFTV